MKKYYQLLFISMAILLSSCENERIGVVPADSISFRLFNYTDKSYQNAELFVGAINADGDFVPTDSREYSFVPSKLSPTDTYTNLDNCTISCGNEGLIDGYHYFTQQGEFFVQIPFSPDNNNWELNLDDILAISDDMAFLFRLPDGTEQMIGGFNVRITLIDNEIPIAATTRIILRDNDIEGGTTF